VQIFFFNFLIFFLYVHALKCTFLITYDVQALKKKMILIWQLALSFIGV